MKLKKYILYVIYSHLYLYLSVYGFLLIPFAIKIIYYIFMKNKPIVIGGDTGARDTTVSR